MEDDHPCCYGGHCCVIHGCKYRDPECPIVLETREQLGGCEECGLESEGYHGELPEFDNVPYGCPHCASTRVVFSSAYDIPKGTRPKSGDPIRYFVKCLACGHEGQWADFKGHKDRQTRNQIMSSNPFHLGHLVEGTVEQDPMTDLFVIRTPENKTFNPQEALGALKGQAVRFTLVSFDDLQKLAKMVEDAGGGQVLGLGTVGGGKKD